MKSTHPTILPLLTCTHCTTATIKPKILICGSLDSGFLRMYYKSDSCISATATVETIKCFQYKNTGFLAWNGNRTACPVLVY